MYVLIIAVLLNILAIIYRKELIKFKYDTDSEWPLFLSSYKTYKIVITTILYTSLFFLILIILCDIFIKKS